jgi:NDP-sugar pyrophosphorylase family protein
VRFAIVAAGEGSRLRAEGVTTPKPLVEIGGVPILERLIVQARENGAREVSCIVNAETPALVRFLGERSFGIPVRLIVKSTPSSLHSLHELCPHLGGEPFCLFTADAVFLAQELRDFLEAARGRTGSSGLLAVTGYVHDEKPLYVDLKATGEIGAFRDTAAGVPCVTGGIYYLSPDVIPDIGLAVAQGVTRLRNALSFLLERGHRLDAFAFSRIVDVDRLSDIAPAEELLALETAARSAAGVEA